MNFYRTWDVILDEHHKITSKEVDAFVEDRFPSSTILKRNEKDYKFHGISDGIQLVVHIEIKDGKISNSIYVRGENIKSVNALLDSVGFGIIKKIYNG